MKLLTRITTLAALLLAAALCTAAVSGHPFQLNPTPQAPTESPAAQRPGQEVPPAVRRQVRVDPRDEACLAAAAWNEARGVADWPRLGIMHVVVTRSRDDRFSSGICGAVLGKGQFQMSERMRRAVKAASISGTLDLFWIVPQARPALEELRGLARSVLAGETVDPTNGATHFYSPGLRAKLGMKRDPYWAKSMVLTASYKDDFRFMRLESEKKRKPNV